MIRQIIHIDENKCNGCGLCARACHEGAIDIIDGKARLVRENFCDGFGDCLPGCPTGAITFENREAPEYNEKEVLLAKAKKSARNAENSTVELTKTAGKRAEIIVEKSETDYTSSQKSTASKSGLNLFANLRKKPSELKHMKNNEADHPVHSPGLSGDSVCRSSSSENLSSDSHMPRKAILSQLHNWPPQIKLAPLSADYYNQADLLIAADCTAYAYANFHSEFMEGCTTLIGCPKLDQIDYSEKLAEIFRQNTINTITIIRMEVPCCGGLPNAVRRAVEASGKTIPMHVITVSANGNIL